MRQPIRARGVVGEGILRTVGSRGAVLSSQFLLLSEVLFRPLRLSLVPALSSLDYLQPLTLALGPQCCAAQPRVFSTGLEHLAEVLGARDWSPSQPASSRQPEQSKGDCSQRPVGDVSLHTSGIERVLLPVSGLGLPCHHQTLPGLLQVREVCTEV